MGTEIRTSGAGDATTYVEVVFRVDHDANISNEELADAFTQFEGETLVVLVDKTDPTRRLSAVVDAIHSTTVHGDRPPR